jgi:hypothetical protein
VFESVLTVGVKVVLLRYLNRNTKINRNRNPNTIFNDELSAKIENFFKNKDEEEDLCLIAFGPSRYCKSFF